MTIDINTVEVGTRIKLPWDDYPWLITARTPDSVTMQADWPRGYSGRWMRPTRALSLMVKLVEVGE